MCILCSQEKELDTMDMQQQIEQKWVCSWYNTLIIVLKLIWTVKQTSSYKQKKKSHSSQGLVVVHRNLGISIVAKMQCIPSGWWKDLGLLYIQWFYYTFSKILTIMVNHLLSYRQQFWHCFSLQGVNYLIS